MHVVVGVLGALLVALMLLEIFVSFLLPRRVKRDPRFVRLINIYAWRPWRWVARKLPDQPGDTLLGVYGPLSLLMDLVLWVAGMMLGYAFLQWAGGSHLSPSGPVDFGDDLFFSSATLVSSGTAGLASQDTFARVVQVIDAASGFAVLTIVIAYLPALYQAFSRRETTVSKLDARAGSPPSAGRLVVRSAERGGWARLNDYLAEWETWSAELMETHLSYPALAYFRSQHVNQNWLSALCTILDACALTIAAAPTGTVDSARFTYAISRHAVADLAYTFRVAPTPPAENRLPQPDFDSLLGALRDAGVQVIDSPDAVGRRLNAIRSHYEPYVNALAWRLELTLPPWIAPESPTDNWRTTAWH